MSYKDIVQTNVLNNIIFMYGCEKISVMSTYHLRVKYCYIIYKTIYKIPFHSQTDRFKQFDFLRKIIYF